MAAHGGFRSAAGWAPLCPAPGMLSQWPSSPRSQTPTCPTAPLWLGTVSEAVFAGVTGTGSGGAFVTQG